ncbi:uncharacterized protein BT62DRAFT_347174 [Guyanagaster necrorhizus]|uniref:Uncharacterized protein n=1 Tax=Guyanagaster necrorhizus TaxID=856835 RepID=A0A9P7VM93_9AGAR|nr:uncharacterized protein BT62DRAFT_347174 [Guyanagaster necrorhizus MCA 3950]KAG7443052.1 hypothetical protein BT62DRAFT_347174 [Guyanagaster necrorhizus MCA 3950]
MPAEVIDRMSLSPHSQSLSTYFNDLGEIIADNYSSPAASGNRQGLPSGSETPTYEVLVFREASEVARPFHDVLSRDGPLPTGLDENGAIDSLTKQFTNRESICAPGFTICDPRSIQAFHPTVVPHEPHASLPEQHCRVHNLGIDAVNPCRHNKP